MAKHSDANNKKQPVKSRIDWLLWLNLALNLGLWALILLGKFKWNG